MATLKFAKLASKIKIEQVENKESKSNDVIHLKEEVKYLKKVLQLKSTGGGISELVYRLKNLENENRRLKDKYMMNSEVDILVRQNVQLQEKLQILKKYSSANEIKSKRDTYDLLAPRTSMNDIQNDTIKDNINMSQKELQPSSAGIFPVIKKEKKGLISMSVGSNKDHNEERDPGFNNGLSESGEVNNDVNKKRNEINFGEKLKKEPRTVSIEIRPKSKQASPSWYRGANALPKISDITSSPLKKEKDPYRINSSIKSSNIESRVLSSSMFKSINRKNNPSKVSSIEPITSTNRISWEYIRSPHINQYSKSRSNMNLDRNRNQGNYLVTSESMNLEKLKKLQMINQLFQKIESQDMLTTKKNTGSRYNIEGAYNMYGSNINYLKNELDNINFN